MSCIGIQKTEDILNKCGDLKSNKMIEITHPVDLDNNGGNVYLTRKEINKRYYEKKKREKRVKTLERLNDEDISIEEFREMVKIIFNQIADAIVILAKHKRAGDLDFYNTNLKRLNLEIELIEEMWCVCITDILDNVNPEISQYGYKISVNSYGDDLYKKVFLVDL